MNKAMWFFGASVLLGSVLFAASARTGRREETAAPSKVAMPSAEKPAQADLLLAAQVDALRVENDELRIRLTELQAVAKAKEARDAEEKDPFKKRYADTKLMDDRLREKLRLTVEQESAMRACILAYLKEQQAAMASKDLDAAQKQAEVARLKSVLESQFQSILAADQYAEMTQDRAQARQAARDQSIEAESAGYRQFFGLDPAPGQEFDAVLKTYYAARPDEKPAFKWQGDNSIIDELLRLPSLSEEQRTKIRKHFEMLNSRKR